MALILVFCLVLGIAPIQIFADSEKSGLDVKDVNGDDYHYEYFDSWFETLVSRWKKYEPDDYYSKYTEGQDGVFIHPNEEGQKEMAGYLKTALADIKDAKAANATDNYTEISVPGMRLNDLRYILDTTYGGDAYAEANFAGNRNALNKTGTEAIAVSDVILLNVSAMNLGFTAVELQKYITENGVTYPMAFGNFDNMKHRDLVQMLTVC